MKNNDVELAFPFWLNEYSATSDGQKMAAVVTAGYIATQIVIFDFLEERYYRAVPDHRQF